MESKLYRMREFVNPADDHSLVIDTSKGLSNGALPGLERFAEAVKPVLPLLDGLVTSPGQVRRLTDRTRTDAGLLVRVDWTNALRDKDFVLPPETIHYMLLTDPIGAQDLGSSAMVTYFLLGFDEEIDARCMTNTVQLAFEGSQVGLPLIIDLQPIGSRIVLPSKAIELGVSYALEGGADGITIPWPGTESFKTILTMAAEVPVWVKPDTLDPEALEIETALKLGAVGVWLDERIFAQPDPAKLIQSFSKRVHTQALETA
jgi:DhnA family fructose-bisphosphate aldolase class Ia